MEWREIKKKIQILNQNAIFLYALTGCFLSFKNERGKTRDFTITKSSEVSSYKASYSHLYGTHGWCSSSVSLPQYLQADFGQFVTVTGVATQGDAQRNNWVTSYLIRYGYDRKTWISYGAGKVSLQGGIFFSFMFRDLKLISQTSYDFVFTHLKFT